MYIETSGNIRSQIGQSLNLIRVKVDEGDALGIADHLTFLIAISAPKLEPHERDTLKLPKIQPGRDKNGDKQRALFNECMEILSNLLCFLSEKGLYAYKDIPIGDASELALVPEVPDE